MRFLGAIFDHRVPLGQNSGHHDVHGSAYGHHVQVDVGPGETAGLHDGIDIAALSGNTGAQSGKALYMLVDGADAAEIAAAGHGNLCPAETAQQSADEIVGSPELPGKLIRGPGGVDVTAVNLHRVAVDGADGRAKLLQNLQNRGNVGDLGDVFNAADAVHQNGGGNNGNGGVLRTADLHLAEQRLASVYDVFCQRSDLVSGILLRGESLAPGLVCPSGRHFMHPEKKVDSATHYDRRQYSILCLKKQTIPDKI